MNPRSPSIAARMAWLACGVGLVAAIVALGAGPIYRLEFASLGGALNLMRGAVYGALAGVALALVALLWLAVAPRPRGKVVAAFALVLNLLVAAPPLWLYRQALSLPKIHDISTDTQDAPQFVAVLPLRKSARNPVDYLPATAALQRSGYPDLASLRLAQLPAAAFARAERAARDMGWQIVEVAPAALRIEATAMTLLFGFKDDVVIRVRADGTGSVIDVRSLSRVGGSDFGTNAKRVRAYLGKVAAD